MPFRSSGHLLVRRSSAGKVICGAREAASCMASSFAPQRVPIRQAVPKSLSTHALEAIGYRMEACALSAPGIPPCIRLQIRSFASSSIWRKTMRSLVLSGGIFERINEIVHAVDVETGVRIFGDIGDDRYVVRHVVGPGENALQAPFDYSCDNDHAEREYTRLLKTDPTLQWLGELHVHPSGYPNLSRTDRQTARDVICSTEDVIHPAEFIVGVIQRRDGPDFEVFPVLFSKANLKGETLGVDYGKHHLCAESGRAERVIAKTYRYCRMWQYWRRSRRDRRTNRTRSDNAHRS